MTATKPKYLVRQKAYAQVYRAVKKGTITRPENCSRCGKQSRLHAHHEDHNRPLDVTWLCTYCHSLAHRHKLAAPPPLVDQVMKEFDELERLKRKNGLTKRERQVAKLICLGLRNREIAERLGAVTRTIETHRERAFKFTRCTNAAQLIGWMLKHKLISVKEIVARVTT